MNAVRKASAHRVQPLDDRGAVAAEFAVTLPAALLLIALGIGALAAGAQTMRLQGAAADMSRLIARGEPQSADALALRLAGDARNAAVRIDETDRLVCVTLTAPISVIGLATTGLTSSARACAAAGGR